MSIPRESTFGQVVACERARTPGATLAIPLGVRTLADQLTPVLAYRRLVSGDPREAPSFLLESVEGGERQARYSMLGADPVRIVVDKLGEGVRVIERGGEERPHPGPSGLDAVRDLTRGIRLVRAEAHTELGQELPGCFLGGWVGYAAYDIARTLEPEKLASPPADDRGLPDASLALHDGVVAFDHVRQTVHIVRLALVGPDDDPSEVYASARAGIDAWLGAIQTHSKPLPAGVVDPSPPRGEALSNISRSAYDAMIERGLEYIRAGDVFQVVLGQRFERASAADPFDVYRALRAVNPSPYMGYLQSPGCILVAASPEILCRVRRDEHGAIEVTNRPLAGTRRRGRDAVEDAALERELLADEKERAEHVMLVDLARNDVGRVARPGTVECGSLLKVERYSHVMHISSTVTGELREGLDAWDALLAALPVGTISGAPKVRAMQIIDELEPVRRGPYGGGFGVVGLDGEMDMALSLRTLVVPTAGRIDGGSWTYHLQASGGIVADSEAEAEYQETVNKAMAMSRAIDLAEAAFTE